MNILINLDIFLVGLTAVGIGTLGAVAYVSNPRSITNQSFFALSLCAIIWGVLNVSILKLDADVALWVLRFSTFFALWYAYFVFQLFYVFPQATVKFPRSYRYLVLPATALVSILTLTPLVFSGVGEVLDNRLVTATNGPGIALFGLFAIGLNAVGLWMLLRKTFRQERGSRNPYLYVFFGAAITYTLIVVFNFIFPALLNHTEFIPYAAVFSFPFIILTAYAIIRHQLLNIKVIATELLTAILAIATLLEILVAESAMEIVFRGVVFALILIVGFLLIRSVFREVQQREQIQVLADNLKIANEKLKELDKLKSQFLSIASHDLRSPLTAIRNFISLLLDGTYGKLPQAAEEGMQQVFDRATSMAKSIETYLNVSRIEQGRMEYSFEPTDIIKLVTDSVAVYKLNAEKKGLTLSVKTPSDLKAVTIKADIGKMQEVMNNLLDNSIKYTPSGSIAVNVERSTFGVRVIIKDTGTGMTRETIDNKLFKLFSTAEDSLKINASSTGVGMYITKAHVVAHKGKIWAESEGLGRGSSFIFELPVIS